jgi:MSHA biogenesis protein MshN
MSLLNEVLKDLEKRDNKQSVPHLAVKPASSQANPPAWKQALRPLLLALLIISISGFLYTRQDTPAPAISRPNLPVTVARTTTIHQQTQTQTPTQSSEPLKPIETQQAIEHQQPHIDEVTTSPSVIEPKSKSKTQPIKKTASTPVITTIAAQPRSSETLLKPKDSDTNTDSTPKSEQPAAQTLANADKPASKPLTTPEANISKSVPPIPLTQIQNLIYQSRFEEAGTLIDSLLRNQPTNAQLNLLRAQIYLKQNQPAQALTHLQQISPPQPTEYFLSLQAAAWQQTGDHTLALPNYQKLVKMAPGKAEYWLGLGLSAEHQQLTELAQNAYREALNQGTLSSTVVNYIQQRLQILTR